MNIIFFAFAMLFLALAHWTKIIRQSQFIEIYEKAPKAVLGKSLAITFILNLILPLKLGNIFRIVNTGNKLKNGKSFSFATIVVDMLLDFFTITVIYCIFYFVGKNVYNNLLFYLITSICIITILILFNIFKKYIKKVFLYIAGIFNENIELKFLKTIWYSIIAFQDMIKRINKVKLIIYTIVSIFLYLTSYLCLAKFLTSIEINLNFMNVFNMMYESGSLLNPTLLVFYNHIGINGLIYLLIYITVPILLIYLLAYFYEHLSNKSESNKDYIQLFPHINARDRLMFLENYFSAENAEYFKQYLKLNRDVAIIQDLSAGSNATTMLCSKDGQTFFRKYSIGKDSEKLYEQVKWIENHKDKIALTNLMNVYYDNDVCSYDMPYVQGAVTCFNYVHTMPFNKSWENLKMILDELEKNLHSINRRKADKETIEKYIDKKVTENIKKIKCGQYIKPLMKYEYIYINGKKYHNLEYFEKKYLNKEYLEKVFENDMYSDIHGDFTIENIVCLKESNKDGKGYYIIDPNTGNVHESPYLDYAKLFQSIHGGYEFLMNTKSVQYYDDKIEFLFTKSNIYYQLFEQVEKYLKEKFDKEGMKSIYYHEIIHWLRLMPYKINKIGENSLLFYAGLIMVATDVEKRVEKNETGNV